MVEFRTGVSAGTVPAAGVRFSVRQLGVLVAGCRNGTVPRETCTALIDGLGGLGFAFFTGCASGVDACFRNALASSEYSERAFVGCAFPSRTRTVRREGLASHLVVPAGLSPKAALRRRTLYLVRRCCMAVLFPLDPESGRWGHGSTLVYRAALEQLKPVFVVLENAPRQALHFRVYASQLFGVSGFWAVPHPVEDGGLCDEPW